MEYAKEVGEVSLLTEPGVLTMYATAEKDTPCHITILETWWSNMATPMQTFLFNYGKEMSGKHIGLIVSSASSGISSVVADAKRLIPGGYFLGHDLWVRSSQVGNCHSMISKWLEDINYQGITSGIADLKADGPPASMSFYTLNGQRISDTKLPSVCRQANNGCYIARIKRDGKYVAAKVIN